MATEDTSEDLPLEERLGRNIAINRRVLGLTQEKLAEQLGVESETISRMERGATIPSLKTLERLARLLGVTIAGLLGEVESQPVEGSEQLMRALAVLPEQQQRFVVGQALGWCRELAGLVMVANGGVGSVVRSRLDG